MKLRYGRKNPHNLYIQIGDEPSDQDISIGYIRLPQVARWLVMEADGTEDFYFHLPEVLKDSDA